MLRFLCVIGTVLVFSSSNVSFHNRYVTQPQDHFDASNVNTWQQAYYVNDKYWKGAASNAPVFVCVGGEGPPLDGSAVVSSVHCNNAVEWLPETGALMLALEHRYYGCHNQSACPVANFSGPVRSSLRYGRAHEHARVLKVAVLTKKARIPR